jgi:hypothetical protein
MRETQLPHAGISVAMACLSEIQSLGRIMPTNRAGLRAAPSGGAQMRQKE